MQCILLYFVALVLLFVVVVVVFAVVLVRVAGHPGNFFNEVLR